MDIKSGNSRLMIPNLFYSKKSPSFHISSLCYHTLEILIKWNWVFYEIKAGISLF